MNLKHGRYRVPCIYRASRHGFRQKGWICAPSVKVVIPKYTVLYYTYVHTFSIHLSACYSAMTSTNMEIHICEWSYLSRYLNFCPQSMRIAHTQKYVLSLCGVETVTNNLWRCSTVKAGKFGFRLGINQPYCTTHLWLSDRLLMYFCLCWGRGHQKKVWFLCLAFQFSGCAGHFQNWLHLFSNCQGFPSPVRNVPNWKLVFVNFMENCLLFASRLSWCTKISKNPN